MTRHVPESTIDVSTDKQLLKSTATDADSSSTNNSNADDNCDDLVPLRCWDCNTNFTEKFDFHEHLKGHVKQPHILLQRVVLPRLKLTLKSVKRKSFKVIHAPPITPVSNEEHSRRISNSAMQVVSSSNENEQVIVVQDKHITETTDKNTVKSALVVKPVLNSASGDLPKIRIKNADVLLKETTVQQDTQRNTNIIALFNQIGDRAKDLGFNTSDTEFLPSDELRTSTHSVTSSSLSASFSTVSELPMKALAEQVSRLQPIIPTAATTTIHGQHDKANPQLQSLQPPPLNAYHPSLQTSSYPKQYHRSAIQQQPSMYYTKPHVSTYDVQQPLALRQLKHLQPIAPRQDSSVPMNSGPRLLLRNSIQHRSPNLMMPARSGTAVPVRRIRPKLPPFNSLTTTLRNVVNKSTSGPERSSTVLGKRPHSGRTLKTSQPPGLIEDSKKRRLDVLTPEKDDDDCQVICMQPTNKAGNLPQIQSVQGGTAEESNLMQLSDSITLLMRPSPTTGNVTSCASNNTSEMTNMLAGRGITVTSSHKTRSELMNNDHSPRDIDAISITPAKPKDKSKVCLLTTVDLTDENPQSVSKQPSKSVGKCQQQRSGALPFRCDLCTAQYPNADSLSKHRQHFHKTGGGGLCELGVPLVNLKQPGIFQKLQKIGIVNYIPLPPLNSTGNKDSECMLSIPLINTTNVNNVLTLGATSILSLGPIRTIPKAAASPNDKP